MQWDQLPRLKITIQEKLVVFLENVDHDDRSVADALLAMLLFENLSEKEILDRFISIRAAALDRKVSQFHTSTTACSDMLKFCIHFIQKTAFQMELIFHSRVDSPSLMNELIQALVAGIRLDGGSIDRQSKTTLGSLYDTSRTNIHTLMRYLPETIQIFRPFIKDASNSLSVSVVRASMNEWIQTVKGNILARGHVILESVSSADLLCEVRQSVFDALKADERFIPGTSHTAWQMVYASFEMPLTQVT